jgi:hypothetical protein
VDGPLKAKVRRSPQKTIIPLQHSSRYNPFVIAFAQAVMHILVVLFFLGLAGSAVIVVLSFIEDLSELLGE